LGITRRASLVARRMAGIATTTFTKPAEGGTLTVTARLQDSLGNSTANSTSDSAKLDNEAFLRDTITAAAKRAGATLLNLITHRFEPQGVTGLALLAESHISIHTWPESGYAAVDVFTCGDHTMPEKACAVLAAGLSANDHKLTSFRRETPPSIAESPRDPLQEHGFTAAVTL
jgi:S-adenosylmethionine decarboxylase proenzyme